MQGYVRPTVAVLLSLTVPWLEQKLKSLLGEAITAKLVERESTLTANDWQFFPLD